MLLFTTQRAHRVAPAVLFALFGLLAQSSQAQRVLSFPGAEGAGRYVKGGRGTVAVPTTVFEVTSLADTNTPGTLRYALGATATYRTIVFRVCGTIHLTSKLNISKANTTIAGQTAPGDGICLADFPVAVAANNVVVRFVRFRMGDKNQNKGMVDGSGGDDSFGGLDHSNIIIDHCTMSWSDDEAFTFYGATTDSMTLQWNLISEPLNYSYHFETGDTDYEHHGFGGIWGGRYASFHHNLFAHCNSRTPRWNGARYGVPVGSENCDFRNNVLYNWGGNNVYGGEGGNYNLVNNYYKYGPSTSSTVRSRVANPYKQTTAPLIPFGHYYITGNYVDGSTTVTAHNWRGVTMNAGTAADTVQAKAAAPFTFLPITTQPAADAYTSVLQYVGCVLPARDTLDQRIIRDVQTRKGRIIDVQGGYPHGTPYSTSQAAWPTLTCGPAPVDSDHDGMPDSWETSHGLNPNSATDRGLLGANGYTNLENYLNGLANAVMMLGTNETRATTVALQVYPNPTSNELTLTHPLAGTQASFQLLDALGRVVLSGPARPGAVETTLSLAGLPGGLYVLRYTDGEQHLSARVSRR